MNFQPSAVMGTATSYENLRKLIALRRKELGLSQLAVDDLAGVQSGYTGKIECGMRHFGDMSFGAIMEALGLELAVVRTPGTYKKRQDISDTSISSIIEKKKKICSAGGKATQAKRSHDERRAAASKAGKARWRQWRSAKDEAKRKARVEAKRVSGGE